MKVNYYGMSTENADENCKYEIKQILMFTQLEYMEKDQITIISESVIKWKFQMQYIGRDNMHHWLVFDNYITLRSHGINNDQLKGFTVGTANAKLAPVPLHSLKIPSCRYLLIIMTDDK